MEIYIGNLPDQINPADLGKIIKYVLMPTSFSELVRRLINRNCRVSHSQFDVIDKWLGDTCFRYAHAVIEPDGVARKVVKKLDHLSYQGHSLCVREYVVRSSNNDRRCKHHKNLYAVQAYNRRIRDRRDS